MAIERPGSTLSLGSLPFRTSARQLRRANPSARILSMLLVSLLGAGAVAALLGPLATPARASSCNQGGSLISADWTITSPQVCIGILYTVDGSVTIDSGGSLTLVDGGLSFAKDATHTGYSLNVNAGGSLTLDHSKITVQTVAIDPYLKLALNVAGTGSQLTMTNGSALQFPGWFNATGTTIRLADSTITGLPDAQVKPTGLDLDDNNDSAVISWASTTATLVRSRIDRVYENWTFVSPFVTMKAAANVTLSSGTTLTAYDSFLDVDYSNVTGLHNELRLDATSAAYLYGVTINRSQDPAAEASWEPAFVPDPGGRIDLLRWLNLSVADATTFPVTGATIWSTVSPNGTTAGYPDNGWSTIPNLETLAFLGRASSGTAAWNRTDTGGLARIPLFTDEITAASLPNANSFGNFRFVVAYNTSSYAGGVAFPPYPSGSAADNNIAVTVPFANVYVRTPADLALRPSDYPSALNVTQNKPFSIAAIIYNQGETIATNVSLAAFLDGSRSEQVARVDGLTVSQVTNASLSVSGITALGNHTLMLVVDPNGTVYEGGLAQKANNFVNVSVDILPPPGGFVAIAAPSTGQTLAPGSILSVSGYVRDPNAIGIVGVPLIIQLRSGSTVLANASVTSGVNGFFLGSVAIPANLSDGSYVLTVTPPAGTIQADTRSVTVATPKAFLNTPVAFLGIPWWLFLIFLVLVAAIAIGVTVYFKVYGLGKMVECGECGAFISEDATTCPKCGVEFEKDLAKCSSCQAWIPVDVKQCPECGVEFATGELDAADYETKMRLQYEEVVEKFRAEAQRQLRRSISDEEFQKWWRLQPSFVTFEDWLHEEEEMRRTGSRPCPKCGTLNSLNAKVCHTCGALMTGKLPKRPDQNGGDEAARDSTFLGGPVGRSMIPATSEPEEPTAPKKVVQKPLPEDEDPGHGSGDQH